MSTPLSSRLQADPSGTDVPAGAQQPTTESRLRWLPPAMLLLLGIGYAVPAGAVSGATQVLVIADIGPEIRWGQLVIGVVHHGAAATTVGLLVVAGFLMPGDSRTLARATRAAALVGALWAATTALAVLATFSEVSAIMVDEGGYWQMLGANLLQIELTRLMTVEAMLAWVVTALCVAARTRARAAWAAVMACFALIPVAYTGHSSSSDGHETAVTALAVHLVAVSIWIGGLVALLMLRGSLAAGLQVSVERFSALATWCFVGVGLSGVLFASGTIDEPSDLLDSYWWLIFAKVAAFVVLGVFGYLQRQRVIAGGVQRPGAFARLAMNEMFVMAVALGLAVALSRTPAPGSHDVDTSAVAQLTGFAEPKAWAASAWIEVWRINWLFLILAVVMAGLYLAGMRTVRGRGEPWTTGRALAWLVACAGLIYLTTGAPGVYGRVLFSTHLFIHLTLLFALPILMVFAAPLRLALSALPARTDGSFGPRESLHSVLRSRYAVALADPMLAAVVLVLSLIALYGTPALNVAVTSHPGFAFFRIAFLVLGCIVVRALLSPRRSGLFPDRRWTDAPAALVFITASCAVMGAALIAGRRLLAPEFYGALELTWTTGALADQRLGGIGLVVASILFAAIIGALMHWDRRPDAPLPNEQRADTTAAHGVRQ